jgi:tetratricopeptide (TPR) repeat protein
VVAVTAAAVLGARRHPALAAAWLAWLAALAPGLASTEVSLTAMADRFTYFPAVALSILAGGGAAAALGPLPRRAAVAGAIGVAAWLAALAGLSVRQLGVWRDDVTLWTRPIELDPDRSGRVYTQRSLARELRGDPGGARADMDRAIAIAEAKRHPVVHELYRRRARLLVQLGAPREAIADYGRALEIGAAPVRAAWLRERAALWAAVGEPALAEEDERLAASLAGAP